MPTLELNIVPIRRIYVDDADIVKSITSEDSRSDPEVDIEMDVPSSFIVDNNYRIKKLLIELHSSKNRCKNFRRAYTRGRIRGRSQQ